MFKNIRIIYLYLVSFISLSMLALGIVAVINAITEYCFPTDYVFFREELSSYYDDEEYLMQREINKSNEKKQQIKVIATDIAVVAIAAPLYTYHWRQIQKERDTEGA